VNHRSPDRFFKRIISTTSSGIYKNVAREAWATIAIASFVILWNMATGGYTDLDGIQHDAFIQNYFLPTVTIPLTPFTMSSPFLGYLLGKSSDKSLLISASPIGMKSNNILFCVQSSAQTPPTSVGTKLVRTGV
jgi:hypothetical protein